MHELTSRLLDVLKDILVLEEKVLSLLEKHRQLLIQGKEIDASSIIEQIDQTCELVVQRERARTEVVRQLSVELGVQFEDVTLEALIKLPISLSIREELRQMSQQLRDVMGRIIQIRNDVAELAKHAKAVSDMFFSLLHDSANQTGTYGSKTLAYSRFISVRT